MYLIKKLFFQLFYVDQYAIEEVRAQQEVPILKGYATKMLVTRERLEMFNDKFHMIQVKEIMSLVQIFI